jgi:hypothetical protein
VANIEHWLARLPSMIGPVVLDANNVRAYRDSGWTVEGPFVPADHLRGAVALLEEVRKRSSRPFGGHAPYDLAVRIERFLDDGVYEPHPDAGGQ